MRWSLVYACLLLGCAERATEPTVDTSAPVGGRDGGANGDRDAAGPDADGEPLPRDGDLGSREDAGVLVDAGEGPVAPAEDYAAPGPQAVTSSVERATFAGCSFEVGTFRPEAPRTTLALVVAPGFALADGLGSSRAALDTLAEHVASWGVTTHTVALCTNGNGIDHAKNGEALAAFGASLGVDVVYAGFSAGGLAAQVAGSRAPNARAVLALDAVDASDLARAALDAMTVPVYALSGEPSSCNSNGNMLAQYEGRSVRVLKVNGAQHFIFEGAACSGLKCLLCQGGGETEAEAVRALSTAVAVGMGGTARALAYWRSGSAELSRLIERGLVSELQ